MSLVHHVNFIISPKFSMDKPNMKLVGYGLRFNRFVSYSDYTQLTRLINMSSSCLTHEICLACLTYLIKWHFTNIPFKPYAYKHISCCGLVVYFLWLSWSFVILKYVFVDWNKSALWTLIRGECSKKPLPRNGSDPCATIEKPKLERKGH